MNRHADCRADSMQESSRVGVAFTPFETRADLILRLAGRAEELGFDRVDIAEGWTHDSMILLAQVAARTGSIGLGSSVISAWGRTPGTIALGAASGRPLLCERESRSELASVTRVSVGVPVALAADEQGARKLAAWWLSTYATRMGPLYPRMLSERFGMATAVEAVIEAARESQTPELPAVAEDLAREVTVVRNLQRGPGRNRPVVRSRRGQRQPRASAQPDGRGADRSPGRRCFARGDYGALRNASTSPANSAWCWNRNPCAESG